MAKEKYDWDAIQLDMNAGIGWRGIREKHGCCFAAIKKAINRSALIQKPKKIADPAERKKRNPEYCRTHYHKNIKRYQERAIRNNQKRQIEARIIILEALRTGCINCREMDIVVLDFDHRDRSTKEFNVSLATGTRGQSIKRLKAEIEKCDIRCANCHRRKTAKDGNWWRVALAGGIEPPRAGSTAPCSPTELS